MISDKIDPMDRPLVGQAFDNFGDILVVRRLYDKGSRIVLAPLRVPSSDRFGALTPDDLQARVYTSYAMEHMRRAADYDLLRPAKKPAARKR